jgi:rfaE bifunctional protein nucleotidyltransferase chain/domain
MVSLPCKVFSQESSVSKTLCIAFNGTRENGQFAGDQLVSLKAAYLFARNSGCDKVIIALSPNNEMHSWWQKFIDDFDADVVYDTFHPGNWLERYDHWDKWRSERHIEGRPFDVYKELYRRDGGDDRRRILCGDANATLNRRHIFEYYYYGQETVEFPVAGLDEFGDDMLYHERKQPEYDVYIAPHAKCQGNLKFTFAFWEQVVFQLINAGVSVTVGYNGLFAEHLNGHPLYRKYWGDFRQWATEICRHKLVACGNTGTGWLAAATGTPLLAMQPVDSNMPDYWYHLCGLKSLVEIVQEPDAKYVAQRIIEEVNRVVVMTTGCYDVLHAGHVRHLEASKARGTKLIVALNSDASVRRLKGEGRPIVPQDQRQYMLRSLRCVDEVRIFDGDTAEDLIREVKPNILTNGFGHKYMEIVGKDYVESYGGRVAITVEDGDYSDLSTTKIIPKLVRTQDIMKAVADAGAISINPYGKLKLLAEHFMHCRDLPGDMADVGAYRGGFSLIMRRLAPDKHLHLFDTWSGNPFDDPLCHHKKGEWAADLAECKMNVGENDKTHYHQGVFPWESVGEENDDIGDLFCFVAIDPDTYQTVKDAIDFFWPRLMNGGKLFFDDYGWEPCAGVKKAVDEVFSAEQRVEYPELHSCVVVKR